MCQAVTWSDVDITVIFRRYNSTTTTNQDEVKVQEALVHVLIMIHKSTKRQIIYFLKNNMQILN